MIRAVERDFYFLNPNLLVASRVQWQVASCFPSVQTVGL